MPELAGRFFTATRLGRWINQHFHRFIHAGKTGRYAFRTAEQDRSCFICRAAWAYFEAIPGWRAGLDAGLADADAGRLYSWPDHVPAPSWKPDDPIQPTGWHHDGTTWVRDA